MLVLNLATGTLKSRFQIALPLEIFFDEFIIASLSYF